MLVFFACINRLHKVVHACDVFEAGHMAKQSGRRRNKTADTAIIKELFRNYFDLISEEIAFLHESQKMIKYVGETVSQALT